MRLFRCDDPGHREATLLLPWYVNGTLEEGERARVERHVRECVACRRELETQQSLAEAVVELHVPSGGHEALTRLHARLRADAQPKVPPPARPGAGRRARRFAGMRLARGRRLGALPAGRRSQSAEAASTKIFGFAGLRLHWQYALIAVQALALIWLIGVREDRPSYHTLSTPHFVPSNAVVVIFDGALSQDALQRMLQQAKLRVVDGPNTRGAYTLEPLSGTQLEALAALRSERLVRFAEPAPGSTPVPTPQR